MLILAILLQLIAVPTVLTTLVLLMAAGANSTPKQLRDLKIMLWSIFLIALAGLIGFVITLIGQRYGTACLFGLLPTAACIGLIVWLFVTGAPKREPSARHDGW